MIGQMPVHQQSRTLCESIQHSILENFLHPLPLTLRNINPPHIHLDAPLTLPQYSKKREFLPDDGRGGSVLTTKLASLFRCVLAKANLLPDIYDASYDRRAARQPCVWFSSPPRRTSIVNLRTSSESCSASLYFPSSFLVSARVAIAEIASGSCLLPFSL